MYNALWDSKRWPSFTKFKKDTTVTPEEIHNLVLNGSYEAVKHQNTARETINLLIVSDKWYIRLVGFCTKKFRKEMFELAIQDPKSTVRAAAYKGAFLIPGSAFWNGWVQKDQLLEIIKKDTRVHGYFRGWIND